jgi:ribosomal protein L16 Arg81 hydroxylase
VLDLGRLIDPVSRSAFFAEYWEEKPLLVQGRAPDYYAELLSVRGLDALLTSAELPAGVIDVVNADGAVSRADFTTAGGTVDLVKVYQLFGGGCSILLQELHKWLPSLAHLCRAMEADFSAPFQTNIYLTPPNAKAFAPHYDTHDVFVLQVAGSKEWQVCPVALPLPLRGQRYDSAVHQAGEPILSARLEPGDVLYVPRGFMHHARSAADLSLHITLGALCYTWSDVVLEAVSELCLSDPQFRRALPRGFAGPDFDAAAAETIFAELVRELGRRARPRAALERFADELAATRRPLIEGQLEQIADLAQLSVDEIAGARPGLLYRLSADNNGVRIRCHGREVTLPAQTADAVRYALENRRYAIKDLPGGLHDGDKLLLMRRLIGEGMVIRLAPAS